MSKDRNDHYIPEKKNFLAEGPPLVEITTNDIKDTILVEEVFLGIGQTTTRRGIALGVKDERNRGPGAQWWVDYSDTVEDGAHWSSFEGYRVCIDIDIRQVNEREVNSWKGRDEIRGRTYAKVLFNKEPVYEVCHRDISQLLLQLQVVIPKLMNLPALMEHLRTQRYLSEIPPLIGRKVFYQNHPGIIRSFIGHQGCVTIEADPGPWPTPVWDTDDDYEKNEDVKTDILSPHIWWYRD